MEVHLSPPAPELADVISQYALLRNPTPHSGPPERFPPAANAGLLLNAAEPIRPGCRVGGLPLPAFALFGPATHFNELIYPAPLDALAVRLTPTGFYHLFGQSPQPVVNVIADLPSLLPPEAQALVHALGDWKPNQSAEERLRRANTLFLALLKRNQRPPSVVEALVRRAGSVPLPPSLEELARLSGVSSRHLGRLFRERTGLTPKLFLRIGRFEWVLQAIKQRPKPSCQDVLHAGGYYDQPHFLHDFHALLGQLPDEFRRTDRPVADILYQL